MRVDAHVTARDPDPSTTQAGSGAGGAMAAGRLTLPPAVSLSRVRWAYLATTLLVHLLAFLACMPWLFTMAGLVALLVGVPVFGQGINLCYHRLLAHRAFRVPLGFEHFLAAFALCSLEDTPIRWVTTHRAHHVYSDERPDPHSPLVTFIWGHVGWLMYDNADTHSLEAYQKYARDLVSDRFYRRLEARPGIALAIYLSHLLLLGALGAGVGMFFGGQGQALRTGLSVLVWGGLLRTVVVWHVTWSVNSLAHVWGYRSHQTADRSRNNWLVGLLASGEGWHNNHHYDPTCASVQQRWWELDLTYYTIKLMAWVGLASQIVPPRDERRAAAARQTG